MLRQIISRAARGIEAWAGSPPPQPVQQLHLTQPAKDETSNLKETVRFLADKLGQMASDPKAARAAEYREYREFCHELAEARRMGGSGPWQPTSTEALLTESVKIAESADLSESDINSQGAMGDFELALQNVDWRREINFSWLQFSRWGIQQIILISRLYYLKNPIIRRLIDICALYVFARGVEVSSSDETANEVLKDFFRRNAKVFSQTALIEHEKRTYYDGNLFFVFFPDEVNKGQVSCRLLDTVEMQDIITDPDDADTARFFLRGWTAQITNLTSGSVEGKPMRAYYPAMGYNPSGAERPAKINEIPVLWDNPVLHRKCGFVGKWKFGCPIIYPALDWAKASRKFLEACAAVKAALAQISMQITTKGGMQALAGIKQQLETTVGTGNTGWWDQNPTAVNGSIFAAGTGTQLAAFKSSGEGGDPEEVRQYKLMCCMVVGVPETFLADVKTGNLATATSLDRPTELCFNAKQESWRETFVTIAEFVLTVSAKAENGKIREALEKAQVEGRAIQVYEAKRVQDNSLTGTWHYEFDLSKAPKTVTPVYEIAVNFPAIREGDIPALVTATVQAMTLGNAQGQVVGIDEKAGIQHLYQLLGIEDGTELADKQYPDYDPERVDEPEPAAVPPVPGVPAAKGPAVKQPGVKEALDKVATALHSLKESR